MNNNNLHAHVSTASADCDGPTYNEYVTVMNQDELDHSIRARGINDFSELMFKERVLGNHASFHPMVEVNIRIHENGFSVSEATEEGYRSVGVTWCEDDCDTGETTHRDVFAEQMGY